MKDDFQDLEATYNKHMFIKYSLETTFIETM